MADTIKHIFFAGSQDWIPSRTLRRQEKRIRRRSGRHNICSLVTWRIFQICSICCLDSAASLKYIVSNWRVQRFSISHFTMLSRRSEKPREHHYLLFCIPGLKNLRVGARYSSWTPSRSNPRQENRPSSWT